MIPAGIFVSLLIETVQYIFAIGIADVDDLFNNGLGVVLGCFLANAFYGFKEGRAKRGVASLLIVASCLALPICTLLISESRINGKIPYNKYSGKHLQNSEIQFQDDSMRHLQGQTLPIYSVKTGTQEDAVKTAENIFECLGTDAGETIPYDEDCFIFDKERNYCLIYTYVGSSYELKNMSDLHSITVNPLNESGLRSTLSKMGIVIPSFADFTSQGNNNYEFSIAPSDYEKGISGTIQCDILDGKLHELSYSLFEITQIDSTEIPQLEELKRIILNGDFYVKDTEPIGDIKNINILSANIVYEIDSKAIYRPIIEFNIQTNEGINCIYIPV